MEVWRHSLEAAPVSGPFVVTLGTFDGVHAGHRELLRVASDRATALGQRAAVVTFDPHPTLVVAPQRKPQLLMTLEQRLAAAVTKQRRRRPGGIVRPSAEIFEDPFVKEEAVSVEDEEGNDDIYEDGMGDILEEEEEEEQAAAAFLSQQFRCDYDRLNADRLERLAKEAIIQEYLVLEKTVERLEGRLEAITAREEDKARRGEADYEFHRGEVPMEPDMAAKIRIFQAEIGRLGAENARLLAENGDLQSQLLLRHLDDEDDDSEKSHKKVGKVISTMDIDEDSSLVSPKKGITLEISNLDEELILIEEMPRL